METEAAKITSVSMQIEIEAPPTRVWQALTAGIGGWWPADFYTGGEPGARNFELEDCPGGHMVERWDSGGGVLWGTVVAIEPNKSLQVLGHLFPGWGGPAEWYGSWTLSPSGDGTILEFSDTSLGRVSVEGTAEKDAGWQFLWAALKASVEGKPEPNWPD